MGLNEIKGGGSLSDKGTGTGVGDTYGASVDADATNSEGKVKGTGSDPAMNDMPPGPNL